MWNQQSQVARGSAIVRLARVSSRRHLHRLALAVLVSTSLVLFGVGVASAAVDEVVVLNGFGEATVNGQFGVAVDQSTGDVYLGNLEPLSGGANAGSFLFQFTPSETESLDEIPADVGGQGSGNGQFTGVSGVAVDAHTSPSSIYAIDTGGLRIEKFNAETLAYESQFAITSNPEVGLAVDSAGTLYLPSPGANEVQELTSAGAPGPVPSIKGSGADELVEPTRVAVDTDGNVYVVDHPGGVGRLEKFNSAGVFQSVLDNSDPLAVAVDPSNNDVWVVNGPSEEETVSVYDPTGTLIAQTAEMLIARIENISVYGATHEAFVTARGTGHMDRLAIFIPGKPAIDGETALGISQTSATLEASINPDAEATTYQFEYGLTEAYGQSAPTVPASVGSDSKAHSVSERIIGLTPNTLYFYRVVAENSSGVAGGQGRTFLTSPSAPAAGTASALSGTEATLTGTLNPGGHDTHYSFEYGTSACPCNSVTPSEDAGAGTSAVEASARLSNLTPLTLYHYRLAVTNQAGGSGGVTDGAEGEFFTPEAPVVSTEPPANVGSSSAVLAGEILAQGAATGYRFEYGQSAAYGQSAPAPEGEIGATTTGRYVTVQIEGLAPGTEYHYRLVALNGVGESAGADRTFTTNGAPFGGPPAPSGFSLTGPAPATPIGAVYPSLTGLTPRPAPVTGSHKSPSASVTQKRTQALKACKRDKAKRARRKCETAARRRYPTVTGKASSS